MKADLKNKSAWLLLFALLTIPVIIIGAPMTMDNSRILPEPTTAVVSTEISPEYPSLKSARGPLLGLPLVWESILFAVVVLVLFVPALRVWFTIRTRQQ